MGERASYVVIEEGEATLHGEKFGAERVATDLFWGPAHATSLIRSRARCDALYEDGWCEGGAVINVDQRTLVFFGSMAHLIDIGVRRALLRLMREPWNGWRIRWAHGGVADLACAAGIALDAAVPLRERPAWSPTWACPHATSATLVTVDHGKGAALYALLPTFEQLVACGSDAILATTRALDDAGRDAARILWSDPKGHGPTRATYDCDSKTWKACPGVPAAGLHVDVARRRLLFWSRSPTTLLHWASPLWPGWTLTSLADRFEEHLAVVADRVSIELPSAEDDLRDAVSFVESGALDPMAPAPAVMLPERADIIARALARFGAGGDPPRS